ncbi:MAG TPA: hypothetical protein VFX98_11410 [Longimicrobiaceae bacterium]|nr:hypothetical protein [Longimicrobiaceae bacterium]
MNTHPLAALLQRIRDGLRNEAATVRATEQPLPPERGEEVERLARAAALVDEAAGLVGSRALDPRLLSAFADDETTKLRTAKLHEPEALWSRAGASPTTGLETLEQETKIPRARLATVLAAAGKAEAARLRRPGWLARHWLDLAVLIGLVTVAALAARALPSFRAGGGARHVELRQDLPAFTSLRPEHLALVPGAEGDSGFARVAQAAGRVTLSTLPRSTVLRPRHLGGVVDAAALEGRRVLSLALASDRALYPGTRIGLLFSPRQPAAGAPGAVVDDVLLLSAAPGDSAVVVAVPAAALPVVAAHLGASRVHALHPPPTAPPAARPAATRP